MDEFLASCEDAANFPRNLVYHDTYEHNLTAYLDRLDERESQLFSKEDEASLDLLEYDPETRDLYPTSHAHVKQLKDYLHHQGSSGSLDPICRYAFLHAPNSRERLYTSRRLLTYLLTYYQVMPSLLDFLFPFGRQEYARDLYFSGFRHETRLEPIYNDLQIKELGRSGRELRMCYSLKAVEPSEYNPSTPWSIRQTVVYHSLDVETEKAFWIVIKGDELIRERIEDVVAAPKSRKTLGLHSGKQNALVRSLAVHMIVCDWCAADWRWYLIYLEEAVQDKTRSTLAATVQDERPQEAQERPPKSVTWSTTTSTLGEKRSLRSSSTFTRLSSSSKRVFRSNSLSKGTSLPSPNEKVDLPLGWSSTPHNQMGDVPPPSPSPSKFSFTDLQRVQLLEDKANEVFMILCSNIKVLGELKDHYQSVVESEYLPTELVLDRRPDIEKFQKRVTSVMDDLEMQKARTKALLRLLADRKSLLHGILEYQNIEASKLLAVKAQESTENMEFMTKDMHILARKTTRETVSMRIITLVTLFFLPGTFISTIMSTDIVQFQTNSDGQSEEVFSSGALQLFVTICLPLMLATFIAWYGVYWWVNRKDEQKRKNQLESSGAV